MKLIEQEVNVLSSSEIRVVSDCGFVFVLE